MRLAIVDQDYRADGALERICEPALEALLARNVAISLITRAWPATKLKLIEPVICNPFHVGLYWRDRSFARAACRAVGDAQADLVQSAEPLVCCDVHHAYDGVHAVRMAELSRHRAGTARAMNFTAPRDRYRVHAERRMYRSRWLRAVICHSQMTRDEIVAAYAFDEAKVHVVYPPVDCDLYRPASTEERVAMRSRLRVGADAVVYVVVAEDAERDGVASTIDAFEQLSAASRLVVVGSGASLDRARRRVRARGLSTRTIFAADSDPRAYYAAADVLARPAQYEPTPVVPLTAMASGLAVVTSTKSGAAEIVRKHDCGRVCQPGDTAELALHLQKLADPACRARLAENARRAALPLSPSAVTLELVLLYRDLLAAAVAERANGGAARATAAEPEPAPAPPE